MSRGVLWVASLGAIALVHCGPGAKTDARFPPRDQGCQVQVFAEQPTVGTDNIGPVQARCDDSVPDADCLRTLQDAVCRLGGDVVWGIGDKPTKEESGKNRWFGRAAHTRSGPDAH